jgi:hypothetical protein
MMRWFVGLLGFALGILLAVAVLLARPAQLMQPAAVFDNSESVRMTFDQALQRGVSDGPFTGLGIGDEIAGGLGDAALDHLRFDLVVLDGGEFGGRALAVKLTALGRDNDLLAGRLTTQSAWNLVWPGQGSLFLIGSNDQWPLISESLTGAARGAGFDLSPGEYPLHGTGQPGLRQEVIGASGRLANAAGRYRELRIAPGTGGALELQLRER